MSLTPPEMLERLASHRALGSAPATEHAWLVDHGYPKALQPGEVLTQKGELSSALYVFFTGHLTITVDRGAGAHRVFEWRGGDVGGALPFSRGARPPNDVVAEQPTEMLVVDTQHFPELIRECPSVTATLVHQMLDRARMFNTNDLRDEKLVSLGRLAAGLAHELNNPASAAVRSARRLAESVSAAEKAAIAVGEAGLSEEQLAAIDTARQQCINPEHTYILTSMERADREDAISQWLDDHGVSDMCATPLADSGIGMDELDALAEKISGHELDAALCWIATGVTVSNIAGEIETAARRIHELVDSVKRFTFMDHAPIAEPVDLRRGISDTFTMLASKMREKKAQVLLDLPDDMPRAHGVGAELNQVWMNLIDNALDAVGPEGNVKLTARRELNRVVVRITDDGPGIPPEILGKIFDPFFTTKAVGKGTGMGLETVRRIIRRHQGEIDVESRPGHTEFRVALPVER